MHRPYLQDLDADRSKPASDLKPITKSRSLGQDGGRCWGRGGRLAGASEEWKVKGFWAFAVHLWGALFVLGFVINAVGDNISLFFIYIASL